MKTQPLLTLLFSLLVTTVFSQTDVFQSDKLKEIWSTSGFDVPESVFPLPEKNTLFIANIGSSSSDAKDTNGYISKLSLEGKIISLKWCVGLHAPKGMGIFGNSLFVSDIDRIAEIDLQSGKIIKFYPVEGSLFLNDIAISTDGTLYISDSKLGKIYKLKDGEVSDYMQSKDFPFANGIIIEGNNILLGTGKNVVSIDIKTATIINIYENTGSVDGLAVTHKGNLLFSDWSGIVSIMIPGKEKEILLDTSKKEKSQSADFGFWSEKKLIYVPTFFGNSVVCYELKE